MPHPNAKPTDEVDERREKIRTLMAKGIQRPGKLMNMPEVSKMYTTYKWPYERLRDDIKVVKKENAKMVKSGLADEALGEYYCSLNAQLINACEDYKLLNGSAKVGMGKHIMELIKSIAKARGIDPEKIDPKPMMVAIENKQEVKAEGNVDVNIPEEVIEKVANIMAVEYGRNKLDSKTSKGNGKKK